MYGVNAVNPNEPGWASVGVRGVRSDKPGPSNVGVRRLTPTYGLAADFLRKRYQRVTGLGLGLG